MNNAIALDCETTGLDFVLGACPFMVTACDDTGELFCWEFEVDPYTRKVKRNRTVLKDMLKTLKQYDDWIFHHANFDLRAFAVLLDVPYEEIVQYHKHKEAFWDHIHCTLIASHVIDSKSSHGLKDLAERYLGVTKDDEKRLQDSVIAARRVVRSDYKLRLKSDPQAREWDILGDVHADYWLPKLVSKTFPNRSESHWNDVCEEYALRDVERTIGLWILFKKILETRKLEGVYFRSLEALRPILRIEGRGMNFFVHKARNELSNLQESIGTISTDLKLIASRYDMPELNLESPDQMRELLYQKMGLPPVKVTPSGRYSADAEALEALLEQFEPGAKDLRLDFLLRMKELRMELTTTKYIRNYLGYATKVPWGRKFIYKLFPNLNPTGTGTTRLSSSNPNGQNISTGREEEDDAGHKIKRFNLRELFGPPPGYVWYCIDYSSLQLVIFAYEANDAGMIESFAKGYDFHNYVACGLFNTDSPTKNERRIAKNVNYALIFGAGARKVDTTAGMDGAYELYQNQFPIVAEYMNRISYQVRKKGYVTTAFGYPLVVPKEQPYKGVNYIVQGDEGEIVKQAMVLCDNYLQNHPSQARLIMQIHDELVFECPVNNPFPVETICNLMMSPSRNLGWVTPVTPAIARVHWGDQEKIEFSTAN